MNIPCEYSLYPLVAAAPFAVTSAPRGSVLHYTLLGLGFQTGGLLLVGRRR